MKNNVRSIRRLRNLSQPLLAARVHVFSTTIDAIEKERFIPSIQLAYRIANALTASIIEVFPPEPRSTTSEARSIQELSKTTCG